MLYKAVHHVGDGLDAPMRMPRKTSQVLFGVVGTEIIEHQERVHHLDLVMAECALQVNTRTFDDWPGR